MKTVFYNLHHLMCSGQECMLVSAVGGSGSVPRKMQAHMLVMKSGRLCGTVGGGAIEGKAIELAKELLEKKQSGIQKFVLHEKDAQNLGMVCGGNVTLHFKYASFEDVSMCTLARKAEEVFSAGKQAWLIIGLQTHALSLYDGMDLFGDHTKAEVLETLSRAAGNHEINGEVYYTEQLVSSGKVYIFGGGHVAQALVPVLASVDFHCVVIEDREEFANPALFPQADEVKLITPGSWGEDLAITQDDCICIMTRGHENDLECQAFALRTSAYYIGVIGSRRKVAVTCAKLQEMGFAEAEISRMHTPIGLPIAARTPAEIAVSIAAEMIKCRAEYSGR